MLSITWALPKYYELDFESKPMDYLSHLFGYEGENSLSSYLVSEGLAITMGAEGQSYLNGYSYFGVDIVLTKKGFKEYDKVIEAVF